MKVLLIDFDGTLVDSIPHLYRIYLAFLQEHHVTGSAEEFDAINGPTVAQFVEFLVQRHALPGSLEQHIDIYHTRIADVYTHAVELCAGAKQAICTARSRGIRCAIVTAAQADLVDLCLRRHRIRDLFECVVTAAGLASGKPDPAVYHRALQMMNAAAEDCLAIEDSRSGVAAAVAAGIRTIAFGDRWTSIDPIAQARCWDELEKLLF